MKLRLLILAAMIAMVVFIEKTAAVFVAGLAGCIVYDIGRKRWRRKKALPR